MVVVILFDNPGHLHDRAGNLHDKPCNLHYQIVICMTHRGALHDNPGYLHDNPGILHDNVCKFPGGLALGTCIAAHASMGGHATAQAVALPPGHLHYSHGGALKLGHTALEPVLRHRRGAIETCRSPMETCIRKLASPILRHASK